MLVIAQCPLGYLNVHSQSDLTLSVFVEFFKMIPNTVLLHLKESLRISSDKYKDLYDHVNGVQTKETRISKAWDATAVREDLIKGQWILEELLEIGYIFEEQMDIALYFVQGVDL